MLKKPNQKSLRYLGVVSLIAILAGVGFLYFSLAPEISVEEETFRELQRQKMIKRQTEALEALNKDARPLTEKEIKEQTEALEEVVKNIKPLTEEEIQKQTETLDKLR